MIKPYPKSNPTVAACKDCCAKCCCWVCDAPVANCVDWNAHCLCDSASPEWAIIRSKLKRKADTAQAAAAAGRTATDSADTVNARFAQATGGDDSGPTMSAAEQARQADREERAEDEENEELFAEYAPLHFTGGQANCKAAPTSNPAVRVLRAHARCAADACGLTPARAAPPRRCRRDHLAFLCGATSHQLCAQPARRHLPAQDQRQPIRRRALPRAAGDGVVRVPALRDLPA